MAKVSVEVKNDNSHEVLAQMLKSVGVALEAIGQEAEGYAKADCPVDTGTLRNSLTHEVKNNENAVYVGTNVEYGVYVEYGDYAHTTGKKHFLRDACANHSDHFKAVLKASLDA